MQRVRAEGRQVGNGVNPPEIYTLSRALNSKQQVLVESSAQRTRVRARKKAKPESVIQNRRTQRQCTSRAEGAGNVCAQFEVPMIQAMVFMRFQCAQKPTMLERRCRTNRVMYRDMEE